MDIILILILLFIVAILLWTFIGLTRENETKKAPEEAGETGQVLRRRASDREIEEAFPDDSPRRRRKSDYTPDAVIQELDHTFELPYLADDIISDASRFRIYKRTVKNSEIYALKGDFSTAVSLYEGVHERINDLDTRYKIEANIEYLKNYRDRKREVSQKKKDEARKKAKDPNEVKFTVDGNMPNTINIGVIDSQKIINTDEIADRVISQIKSGLKQDGRVLDDIKNLKGGLDGVSTLKNELSSLNERIDNLSRSIIPESSKAPSVTEAKYQGPPPPSLDTQKILDTLAKITDPGKGSGKGGLTGGAGKDTSGKKTGKEVTSTGEDEDADFELLSEYGRDKDQDELSDEEIFEKILKDSKDESNKSTFEIIGEKRDEDEFDILDKNHEAKMKEEENFYRSLLKTDKRKKKELPILKVSFDFTRLPDEFSLSREKNILEYSFYKYKPMLEKAAEYIKSRHVRDAINYYKVVLAQNIPPEFKSMVRRNINDLTEYLEKYLTTD